MKTRDAQDISEQAIAFLAAEPEMLNEFLSVSGLSPQEMLARADDSSIRLQALHFIAATESSAKSFCEANGLKAGALQNALALLDPHGSSAW